MSSRRPPATAGSRHPDEVPLQAALDALADPVRRSLVRDLAASPPWSRACGSFELPVNKATASHHFAVLRAAGLLEQRDEGTRRWNRLRREEFDRRFPGLLDLVLGEPASTVPAGSAGRPAVTRLLRGGPGLQAGEESDSCGAGRG